MNMEEFLEGGAAAEDIAEEASASPEELDIQKAVVESLAADKVVRDEMIKKLEAENGSLRADLASARARCDALLTQIAEMKRSLDEVGNVLSRNTDSEASTKIALLDRNIECDDRFPGETRDHVLEAIREVRDRDEAEGRNRRAQLLEGVLSANEPNGTLAKLRAELARTFEENGNVVNGPVIDELRRRGISHKRGEEYLLPSEILRRAY